MPRPTACLLLATALCAGCAREVAAVAPHDMHGCPGPHAQPDPDAAPTLRAAVLCLLNAERTRHGLGPLVEDPALRLAAERHSADMARRDYFEHRSPEGVEPWMRIGAAGYRAGLVGENLAWGEAARGTPARAMELWMHSEGHRANVLEPRYTQVGIGLAFDAPEPGRDLSAAVYTTTFGSAAVAVRH